jgi:hypothetical protein
LRQDVLQKILATFERRFSERAAVPGRLWWRVVSGVSKRHEERVLLEKP